jgi:hypothetical protein
LNERVNFEVLLLRAAEQGRTRAIDSLIQDLTELSAGLPQEAGQKKISPAPAREAAPAAKSLKSSVEVSKVEEARPAPAIVRESPSVSSSPAASVSSALSSGSSAGPNPEEAYARLPESTRNLLETEFRATIRGVKFIPPERIK